MKLQELFEAPFQLDATKPIEPKYPYRDMEMNKLIGQKISSGSQAHAYQHPRGNTVIKEVRLKSENDPYLNFVKLALQYQHNPYFPKFYSAKIYLDMFDKLMLVLNMERLQSISSDKLIDTILERMKRLGWEKAEEIYRKGATDPESTGINKLEDYLMPLHSSSFRKTLSNITSDPHLKEMLQAIDKMQGPGWGSLDLHKGNFMIRLSNTGPQIVLIDPVY